MGRLRWIRQGDIILREVNPKKVGFYPEGSGELEISGETGNSHVIRPVRGGLKHSGRLILVEQDAVIEHPEHGSIRVPAGLYELTRVRQWRTRGLLD